MIGRTKPSSRKQNNPREGSEGGKEREGRREGGKEGEGEGEGSLFQATWLPTATCSIK